MVPLDRYAELMEKQMESLGWTWLSSEQFSVKGNDALALAGTVVVKAQNGESIQVENKMIAIDHGGYRYVMNLTYLPQDRAKYHELLDSVIQTFNVVE